MRHLAAVLTLSALLLASCGGSNAADSEEPRVVASFYPLEFLVQEVGGELVTVENLTPPGAEPHDLELTPGQARALAQADLILYFGRGFQPSVESALGDIEGSALDVLSEQSDLQVATSAEHEENEAEEHDDEAEEHDDETVSDPHVWLDPARMAVMAGDVAEQLSDVDPENASAYRSNSADVMSRLEELDSEYGARLARCEQRSLVTSHEAFGYLADAYELEQIGISGIDPEAEPSPGRLAEVARFVDANDVTTIFFEVLVSPAVAETLAQETGAETATLDPLEGPPTEGDYFTAMRANLETLERGLGCS